MSDPVANSEIEDVLSSIRRLVAGDIRRPKLDFTAEAKAEERLVLTPALRVATEADVASADPAEDAQAEPHDETPETTRTEEAAEDMAEAPMAELVEDEADHGQEDEPEGELDDDSAAMGVVAADSWNEDAAEDVLEPGAGEEPVKAAVRSALEAKIAELEAMIGGQDDAWEPDGDAGDSQADAIHSAEEPDHEDRGSDEAGGVAELVAVALAVSATVDDDGDDEDAGVMSEYDDAPEAETGADHGDMEWDDPAPEHEHEIHASDDETGTGHAEDAEEPADVVAGEDASRQVFELASEHRTDAGDEGEDDGFDDWSEVDAPDSATGVHDDPQSDFTEERDAPEDEEPVVERPQFRHVDRIHAEADADQDRVSGNAFSAFNPDEAVIDEDMLRDMVAEIVRQELQGALGERITRNVRKLVRREIHRALASQDFE